ncbi:acetate--CoA ligase [Dechloromonas denitrificans]|uniref:acetate--CoA ligase n=1 Tax=Dechloromonas denitrificans TaxID=281362 RepID=UPI001CFBCF4B|nr:acetate--CoA ligase [Dechloromonas denitrificans]UCV08569.1 acetate--CoA ligase [Dechloromonas denitrificans]
MRPPVIRKSPLHSRPAATASDGTAFSWAQVGRELGVSPAGSLNMAYAAVDRHAHSAQAEKAAFRFLRPDGSAHAVSYRELAGLTDRFGNVLKSLGVTKGDCVFVLCGRICELYVAVLGALKIGAVVSPLFQAFGPEPIRSRIAQAGGKVLVTTASTYQRKVAALRADLPSLEHVLLVDDLGSGPIAGTRDLQALLRTAPDTPALVATGPEDPALLHFTSGTTGMPKGAIHVHGAVLTHYATARTALDLQPDDVFWCTADPGWVTGTSYGIIAPLVLGVTSVVDEAEFDAARWIRILETERVNVWYTAPTAIRLLMKAGPELFAGHRFPDLRFIASVGEALNPEAVWWGLDVLGRPIHDNWWQTETGSIMIANTAAQDIKPGSMGRPLPGITAHVVRRHPGRPLELLEAPGMVGELALETGWPSMFRAYLDQPDRYAACFAGPLYLSGDMVRRDADGYYWFVGRRDDVIKSAGHLIGPFEVESVLLEHPAVAEAGVIGKPDALAGEIVMAFVALRHGVVATEALRLELMAHARLRLGAAVAPKEIAFVEALPHTRSGKIMRRLLKARELGLPEGDSSTLE